MRGAEAVLHKTSLLGKPVVIKERIAKAYRDKNLDEKLRRERTRGEARLLHKAKIAGVACPTVLEVEEFAITMSFIAGKRPEMNNEEAKEAGELLAKLHTSDIIHGDYTPANLFVDGEMFVIDFGLGFVSNDIEDKAVDVFTMLRAISEKESFIKGYESYSKAKGILKRVKNVEKRVRYAF
ncbi:Kae1-associated serine/threonine protein kinase [Candidatus Micrarchaeota archaeon]|nr:Kae1-associated serine/threonine protein kinase [Candidatus Micrarchaeota archaeon]